MELSDASLVKKTLKGDAAAFEMLVNRYKRPVYNIAYRMLGSREASDDAAQETFLRAYQSLRSFKPSQKFSSWIYRIAMNYSIDELRKRPANQVSIEQLVEGSVVSRDIPDGSKNPLEEASRSELGEIIEDAIGTLQPEYRSVILLRHLEDCSYEQIAEILEIPLGTVMNRLYRARRALRGELEHLRS